MTSHLENKQTPEEKVEEDKLIKIIEEKPIKIILDEPEFEEPEPQVTQVTDFPIEELIENAEPNGHEPEAAEPVWITDDNGDSVPIDNKTNRGEKNGKNG